MIDGSSIGGLSKIGNCEDSAPLVALLKSCAKNKDIRTGVTVHASILKNEVLGKNPFVVSTLITMYAKCGAIARANEVLEGLPTRNAVSWSALIAGYAQAGHGREALICFEHMQQEGLFPDSVTFVSVLSACGSIKALSRGEEIHAQIVKLGFLSVHVVLGGALVDMYAKCGALSKAERVLKALPVQDVVSWSALIAGYAQGGHGVEALNCFKRMQNKGLSANVVTFACILKACGSTGALDEGEKIHFEILRRGLLNGHALLGGALVDMYVKCGALAKAKEVLEGLSVRNVVSWCALITGYAQEGQGKEALICFEQMWGEGLFPDAVTFVCILRACSSIGALDKGIKVHSEIVRQGLLGKYVILGGALVDMYSKCGAVTKAKEALERLPVRSVVSWNALMTGYAQGGHAKESLTSFERMKQEGISPDEVTFLCVLTSCSHSGEVERGHHYFMKMSREYGIIPSLEHHTCMVHLFSSLGLLDIAMIVIKKMYFYYHPPVWSALLFSCQKLGSLKLGRWVFDCALQPGVEAALADALRLKSCNSLK